MRLRKDLAGCEVLTGVATGNEAQCMTNKVCSGQKVGADILDPAKEDDYSPTRKLRRAQGLGNLVQRRELVNGVVTPIYVDGQTVFEYDGAYDTVVADSLVGTGFSHPAGPFL